MTLKEIENAFGKVFQVDEDDSPLVVGDRVLAKAWEDDWRPAVVAALTTGNDMTIFLWVVISTKDPEVELRQVDGEETINVIKIDQDIWLSLAEQQVREILDDRDTMKAAMNARNDVLLRMQRVFGVSCPDVKGSDFHF